MNKNYELNSKLADVIGLETEGMKEMAEKMFELIPEYWYHVPASSTGKYHPEFALGEGGLMRHSIAVAKVLNDLFPVMGRNISEREKDLMRIAAIMHDSMKSGSDEDYAKNPYTKHEHPVLAADLVGSMNGAAGFDNCDIKIMQRIIRCHMGQWCTSKYSDTILPVPVNADEELFHLADYLASRKDIEVKVVARKNDAGEWEVM